MNDLDNYLATVLAKSWWLMLLRGLIAIVFAAVIWIYPELSLEVLILCFGAYCLVDGVFACGSAFSLRNDQEHWWALLIEGLLGIVIGLLALLMPGVTALALLFYIAIWAVAVGVLRIIMAIRLRKEIQGEWIMIISGIISVLFGLVLITQPTAGIFAILWVVAAFSLVGGLMLVALSFRARFFSGQLKRH